MNPRSSPSPADVMTGELSALEERLRSWKHDYLDFPVATRAGEYQLEVEEVVLPYLVRLRDEELISPADFDRMTAFIDRQIACLRTTTGPEA